jgi:hypothetical protein
MGTNVSAPLNEKIKGGNIAPKPGGYAWKGFFAQWDWDNWIKPQVDRAVALGLNAVRLIGAPGSIFADPIPGALPKITQAEYDAHWAQLAEYCLKQGLYLYPCLIAKWDVLDVYGLGGNFQDPIMTVSVKTTAAVLAGYSNVIGVDLFQEGDAGTGTAHALNTAYTINTYVNNGGNSYRATAAGTSEATGMGPTGRGSAIVDGTVRWAYQSKALLPADVLAMMAAVRSVTKLRLTMSRSLSDGFGWADTLSMWYQIFNHPQGADFIDMHLYLDGTLPSDPDFQLLKSGKPFLIGEYGAPQSVTTSVQAARFAAVAAIHNRRNVMGSFAWALADQKTSTDPEDQWGIWDNTGYSGPAFPDTSTAALSVTSGRRTAMTDVLPTFNVAQRVEAPYESPNLLSPIQARSANANSTAATGWLSGPNTYLYADPRGIGFSATVAGTSFVATSMRPEWRVSVTGGAYYRMQLHVLAGRAPRAVSAYVDWYDSACAYISSSTAATGTDSVTVPLRLESCVRAHTNAAYGVVIVKVKDAAQAANEAHIVLRSPERVLVPA